ncbi:signal peptidase II [Pollutimonas sp. H1-120]|uniref:signal peptidase II n=1 Tax=Pollutimonas sp. H1-120 TaxID=3148824 RepID=UPI003B52A03B
MPNDASSHPSPRPNSSRFWAWIAGALAIIALDQVTKIYFDSHLSYGERWPLLPFFDFTLLYNPGAAFSFLANGQGWQRWLFTVIALGAIGLIIHLLRRHPGQSLFCASLMCILGGAIGNVIDRIQHGHVIDFLLFYWNNWYFPAFNVADVSITCGAVLLVYDELRRMRREKNKSRESA